MMADHGTIRRQTMKVTYQSNEDVRARLAAERAKRVKALYAAFDDEVKVRLLRRFLSQSKSIK
jgi:hypothetical protein